MTYQAETGGFSAPPIAAATKNISQSDERFLLAPIANGWTFGISNAGLGTLFRITFDFASIWAAMALAWLALEFRQPHPFALEQDPTAAFTLTAYSLFAVSAHYASGLYWDSHTGEPTSKILRIGAINLVVILAAFVACAATQPQLAESLTWFGYGTFLLSTAIMSGGRIASYYLRREFAESLDAQPKGLANDDHKVVVIGGAGYIGSALVRRLLDEDFRVVVLDAMHFGEGALGRLGDRPNCTIIRADFRDAETLSKAMEGAGAVIHLGGLVGDPACAFDPNLTIDVNVTATKLVGEIAKAHGVRRFIFASSCSVYGACDEIVDEESHFRPQSLYAKSKVASEVVLDELHGPDFAVTNLRFATIYGISGRTRFDLVVNLLSAKAVRDGLITVFGSDQWRPFVHVDDVARAVVLALRAPIAAVGGQVFNVGSDEQNFTLGQIAELIKAQVPDAQIVDDDTFVDKRNYRVRFSKIRETLGFAPEWTVEKGIAQVVALMRTDQVRSYSQPEYSNVLYLKERGVASFAQFKIHGWEADVMNVVAIERDDAGRLVARAG